MLVAAANHDHIALGAPPPRPQAVAHFAEAIG